ncbi:MAG: DUF3530 family protein [Methylococcales bacterium]
MPGVESWKPGKLFGVFSVLLLTLSVAKRISPADLSYERQLSDTIARSVREAQPVWLNLDQGSFLSVFLEAASPEVRGAVLIVPGISEHADSRGLVRSLRTAFPAHGWSALTLQMPVGKPDRDLKSHLSSVQGSGARIKAAVDYLATRNVKQFVLIGHGLGAWTTVDYLTSDQKPAANAVVLAGMPVFPDDPSLDPQIETLKNIEIPVLDIYGSRDLDSVIDTAGLRRQWMKKNEAFRQLEIAGANHEFQSETELVFKRIYSWVTHNTPPIDVEK